MSPVVTLVVPMKRCPSPKPEGSHSALEKNSIVNVVFALLLSVPIICVLPMALLADVNSGKFCRLFGPVSASHGSLSVTLSSLKIDAGMPVKSCWISFVPLSKIELPRIVTRRGTA